MNVFVKTKLSLLGIKKSMRYGPWVTNHVGMKVKLCLTCLSVCVAEPAVCGNEDRLLWTCLQLYPDPGSLETKFEKSYGRMRRNWGNSPNIPGRIYREWFELQRRNSGCWSTPSILTVVFRCSRREMVERSHPQFPEIRCWANDVQLQSPPNDKFDYFLTGNVAEKER